MGFNSGFKGLNGAVCLSLCLNKRPMDMSNLNFCLSRLMNYFSFGTKEYKLWKLQTGNLVQLAVIISLFDSKRQLPATHVWPGRWQLVCTLLSDTLKPLHSLCDEHSTKGGTQCLRHCCTSRQVARSIPAGAIGIIYWLNPSGRFVLLGSTQPLTETSTRGFSWGKGGWWLGLTTVPPSCADCLEILGTSTFWSLQDLSRPELRLLFLFSRKGNGCRTKCSYAGWLFVILNRPTCSI